MLCHRCGTELSGAPVCGNCGAPAVGRRRFRPTLTAVQAPDPFVLRAAAVGLEKGVVVGDRFELGAPLEEAPGGWLFAARTGETPLVIRFMGPVPDADARAAGLEVLGQARRLSHEDIVRVYAVGAHGDWLFMAQERLEGLTLAKIVELRREKGQGFSLEELLPIFEQIRDALLHAHRHLAHGGLDPGSIHILPAALKVVGFGWAGALPGGMLARLRTEAGRARTLAPEVRRGAPPTVRGDVFGLGAILYEMLTGQPFADDAPPPSVAVGAVGGHAVDAVVAKATAPDPEARYATVVELAEALATLVDGPPLAVSDSDRTRKVEAPRPKRDAPPAVEDDRGQEEPPVGAGAEAGEPDDPPADGPDAESAEAPSDPPAERRVEPSRPAPEAPRPSGGVAVGRPAASRPPPIPAAVTDPAAPAAAAPAAGARRPPPSSPAASPERPQQGPGGRGAQLVPGPGGGPSVVIDPAFARLDTLPPDGDLRRRPDRTPTQPVRIPPPRRPWRLRSSVGFGLLLGAIVVAVALAAVWVIRRDDEADVAPRVERKPVKTGPAERPLPVVVHPVGADAAAPAPDAAPPPAERPTVAAARPAPPEPEPEPVSEPEPERRAAPEPERPAAPEPEAPAEPEPTPEAPAEPEPTPEPPAEPPPEPPAEPAPAEPETLRCPAGMTLVTRRGFPAGGKKRGALVGPGVEAARAGAAYCIDTYEYPGRGQPPRTGVNFEAARGLCIARGRRLCTDAEWRRGCAGRKGGAWPYGGAFDPAKCNTEDGDGEERAVAPAGSFRRCKSIRGVYDMSGNVAEWTADQTVRGGDFASSEDDAACGGGGKRSPSSSRPSIGFRCCADFTE